MYMVLPSCERARSSGRKSSTLPGSTKSIVVGDLEASRPSGSNRNRAHAALAPLGPEQAAAIFLGPDVLTVIDAAAGRTAAVFGHPGQHPVGAVVIVKRITVIAAVDVMGHPGPPA